MLTFTEQPHEYRWNGYRKPSVTEMLQALGMRFQYPEGDYRIRGTRVHKITEAYDRGILDLEAWRTQDAGQYAGYIDGYLRFLDEIKPRFTHIEHRAIDPVGLMYCGTVDRFGLIFDEPAILDIKTTAGAVPKEVALQLAGYCPLVKSICGKIDLRKIKRYALPLPGDGTYSKLVEYKNNADHDAWISCVNLFYWKAENGLLPKREE